MSEIIAVLRQTILSRWFAACLFMALGSSARADWNVNGVIGVSAQDACEKYVDGLPPQYSLTAIWPQLNNFGDVVGAICVMQVYSVQTYATAGPVCPAGQFVTVYATSGCSPTAPPSDKNNGRQCAMQGNPVSTMTGNKFHEAIDISTAGPDPLSFGRLFNAEYSRTTYIGSGWRASFSYRMYHSGSDHIFHMPDGRVMRWTGTTPQASFADVDLRLAQSGSNWLITDREGTVVTMNASGLPVSVKKRNGYTQTVNYNASNQITSISDSYGRQITYTLNSSGYLAAITGPDGRTVSYTYKNIGTVTNAYMIDKVVYPDDTPADPNDNPKILYHYENAAFLWHLTGITDERNIRNNTWQYDTSGRATLSEKAGGADRVTFAYNADGSVTSTNALNKQTNFAASTILLVKKPTTIQGLASPNCPAANASNTYDARGYVTSFTDWNGRVTNRTVTTEGLETSRTEAVGTPAQRTITTTWDVPKRVPTQIVEPGRTTAIAYDADRLPTSLTLTDTTTHTVPYSTNGQTRTWTYGYTVASGVKQLTSVTGPRPGQVTSYLYTPTGYLSRVTNALGQQINVTSHNGLGQPLTVTDENGVATTLVYNARGWLTSSTVVHASGNAVTQYQYDLAGNVTKITLPDGSFLDYVYDNAGRLSSIVNLGERIDLTLDALGRVTKRDVKAVGGAIARTQSRVYDELGRLLRIVGANMATTQLGYDNNSNLTSTIDPLTRTTSYGYDGLNRLLTSTNALSGVRTTAYDARDNETSVSDERTITTSFVYSAFNEAIQEASPDAGTIVYVRDASGNVTQKTDPRGVVTNYTYDLLDRRLTVSYPSSPPDNVAFTYDQTTGGNFGIGRLTRITDASGSTDIVYDHRGNVIREVRTIGGQAYTTEYSWSLADNLTQIIYPSGRVVTYTRDALGRITAVQTRPNMAGTPVDVATGIQYEPFGPLKQLTYGNGLVLTLVYDQDGRATARKTEQLSTKIQDLAYGYNLLDNVTSITDAIDAARNQSFGYDELQRLISASGNYGSLTYSYDAVHNRLTRALAGGATETFTYGATNNRLQSVTGLPATRSFTYDTAGNVTLDDRGGGNTATVTIGAESRMRTLAVAGSGVTTVNYTYNARGERVMRIESGTTTHFQFDLAGQLLAESSSTGAVTRDYIWLGTTPIGLISGGNLSFIHSDHLERPQKLSDAAKNVVWDGQFTPFGRTHAISAAVANPMRFPGQWADSAAALSYNYFRDCDPSLGRYWSSDSIGVRGGRNRFGYAEANPSNITDPTGEIVPVVLASGIGTAVGSFVGDYLGQRIQHALSTKCAPFVWNIGQSIHVAQWGFLFGLAGPFLPGGPLAASVPAIRSVAAAAASAAASTVDDLAAAAARAASTVGPGSGAQYGTRVHTVFKQEVSALGRTDLRTEVSYISGKEVRYGASGSTRIDVVEYGASNQIVAVYDLKTGTAYLSPSRTNQIQQSLPPSGTPVPLIVIKP